ncbi:MAG TPA: hypothetical protein VK622_15035 [Puia sp.]|nr:hypothetical protein [Puia sp.]
MHLSGFPDSGCLYFMKHINIPRFPAKSYRSTILHFMIVFLAFQSFGQSSADWKLERMPAALETDFALSCLPAHLRAGATVYLLDPEKGYYIARQGNNGFICFVVRTDWTRGEFRQDFAAAISYDAEGFVSIFPVYRDVGAMRSTGKFTALQIRDTIGERFSKGIYKAPAKPGISYMLAPVMRTYVDPPESLKVASFSMPHYMFYAPYMTAADIGGNSDSGGPIVLGEKNDPHCYLILPVGKMEKAQIIAESKSLLLRLAKYKSYFKIEPDEMHH